MKDFYNSLNQTDITKEDYKHAQKLWKAFNIKNLQYVHVFADVFESFRKTDQKEK